jgi:hypothetical protein
MKTTAFLLAFCLVSALVSYPFFKKKFNGDNISISVSESDDRYKISADYPKNKTRRIQQYLDDCLQPSGMSFVNARIDGDISPGNGMHFYIDTAPGSLTIRFDRRKNSATAYRKMKQMGEGLGEIVTK